MFSSETEERWKMGVIYGREKGTNCFWVFFLESECLCIQFHTWARMNTTSGILDVKCFQMYQCTDNVIPLKLVKVVF